MKKLYAVAAMAVLLCLAGFVMPGASFAQCVDNGDGTVIDNRTGLMWQKGTVGPMDWQTAMSYASSLSLGGHSDWWLPTRGELGNLYHSPCKSIMDVVSSYYWSSTTYASYVFYAWNFNFGNGVESYGGKLADCSVRAVRAGR